MRVLLVDDHTLFREGIKTLLAKIDDLNEVLEVSSGQEALDFLANDDDIDVILLDYNLGDMSGEQVLLQVKKETPEIPVIMLSAQEEASLIQGLLAHGASGFITKTSTANVMLSAISLVVSGGVYVPPAILAGNSASQTAPASSPSTSGSFGVNRFLAPKMAEHGYQLTQRQTDVIIEMGKGLSNKEIARALDMSPSTVKVHVAAILRELDAKNRTIAVSMAKDMGLIDN
jgi:DNA-binding NarL/FixJ family response regulator